MILNSNLADGHSKILYRLRYNFFRLANSTNSELAQMLSARYLLCYSISQCFWYHYHLNFTDGQNLLFHLNSPLLVHSNPYFKTNQSYKSIHLGLNCSHPSLASFMSVSQLLCKWETEILWQPDVVTGSVAGELWISACPAIRQCCHSTQGAKEENVTRWELLRRNHASKSPGATGPPQTHHQSDKQAGWSCWSF